MMVLINLVLGTDAKLLFILCWRLMYSSARRVIGDKLVLHAIGLCISLNGLCTIMIHLHAGTILVTYLYSVI